MKTRIIAVLPTDEKILNEHVIFFCIKEKRIMGTRGILQCFHLVLHAQKI